MKLYIISIFLFMAADFYVHADDRISLNGTWRFALAKTEREATDLENFYQAGFSEKKFKSSPVPSNWAVLGYEEPVYRGFKDHLASEGFYLHDFTVAEDMENKRTLLHFGGVWASAEVWLNGINLGRHNSGYTSFAFDVSGKLKTGRNRLAVRVRQATREYELDTFDDWTLGGIYRDVYLEPMPEKRWIDQLVIKTEFDAQFQDADLNIRAMVGDRQRQAGSPYDLLFTLADKEGNDVARRQITIPAHIHTDREVNLTVRVENPNHWTAETPYLYNLRVELLENGKTAHTRTERVGFRQISTEGGVFRINGHVVKLRGVNRHDEHPDVGRATTREHWIQDITLMKEANINYIRMSHYPPARGFIELCDELGMYVDNEIPIGHGGVYMHNPSFAETVLLRSYETVVRDINNPSVIYWSISNETPLTSLLLTSVKTVRALDPTRPVLIPWRGENWLPQELDILSVHYWTPQALDQLAAGANRPVITTEYTHAYGLDGMGGLESSWKALTRHPSGVGGAVWMWADQGLKTPNSKPEKDLAPDDAYLRLVLDGWDGIVDSYRHPTRDYYEVKAVYAQVYPTTDKIMFTPGQSSVRVPIQNDFDFTDLSAVKIDWSVREDDRELDSGSASVSGKPHSVAAFNLSLEKLKTLMPGKTYYAWLIFSNAAGKEITRKAVELEPLLSKTSSPASRPELMVSRLAENFTVKAGVTDYIFDLKTGLLISVEQQGKQLITGLRPIIWRKTDPCERTIAGGQEVNESADLNRYVPEVKVWNCNQDSSKVVIDAEVECLVDENNRFAVAYRYTVGVDGQLDVHYEILPDVTIPWLPVVGMSLQSVSDLDDICWLGLGPYDAYPNKRSAPVLGVWGGKAGSKDVVGNKAARWIERSGSAGKFRIFSDGYMEHIASDPKTIHILSGVLGRPEKGRKADESVPQLETNTGKPFVGEFSVLCFENNER